MNIVSGSCLLRDRYSFKSETNGCSIYMNDVFYVHAPDRNGLFILDLNCNDSHINSIESVSKRCRVVNDNSAYMWHCRLGHIGVKRMKELHKDGLLESLDFDSFDRYEPCLMGKMTRSPFNGIVERADDLLGIIHTDVCGPMSISTRNGYRYFVTFTDDLSRYGYIYLTKHKSELLISSKSFGRRLKINSTRKLSTFDRIEVANI